VVTVVGEATFFPAFDMGIVFFPMPPTGQGCKGFEIPSLGQIGQEEVGGWSRRLADCKTRMPGLVDQENRSPLGRKNPGK